MKHPIDTTVLQTVADACRVARHVQQDVERLIEVTKDDRSPVTVADFAVQAVVAIDLAEQDPDAPIVGEERADMLRDPDRAALLEAVAAAVRIVRPRATTDDVLAAIDRCDHDGTADRYWALDPIDGTKGFLRGQQYAIALGRIERGVVTAGVMGCPNLPSDHDQPVDRADDTGTIYFASRDAGAFQLAADGPTRSPQPIRAADPIGRRPIRVCESVEAAHSKHSDVNRIVALLGRAHEGIRIDSQCKYSLVARGQADAYLRLPTRRDYTEKIWDHAAGSIIATEAGALVSDITGAPLDFRHGPQLEKNRGIICTAPELHPAVLEAIEKLEIGSAV